MFHDLSNGCHIMACNYALTSSWDHLETYFWKINKPIDGSQDTAMTKVINVVKTLRIQWN